MSAVTVGISGTATDGVVSKRRPGAELSVRCQEAGINNVGISVGASGGIIDVAGGAGSAVRDSSKTPGCPGLSGQGSGLKLRLGVKQVPNLVLFNLSDLYK